MPCAWPSLRPALLLVEKMRRNLTVLLLETLPRGVAYANSRQERRRRAHRSSARQAQRTAILVEDGVQIGSAQSTIVDQQSVSHARKVNSVQQCVCCTPGTVRA